MKNSDLIQTKYSPGFNHSIPPSPCHPLTASNSYPGILRHIVGVVVLISTELKPVLLSKPVRATSA